MEAVRAIHEYYKVTESLSDDERLKFYESFSLGLTVAIRMVIGDPSIGERDKLLRIEMINDILHTSTAKVTVQRLKLHEWTEKSFWAVVACDVFRDQATVPLVDNAIRRAFDAAKSNLLKNSQSVEGYVGGPD